MGIRLGLSPGRWMAPRIGNREPRQHFVFNWATERFGVDGEPIGYPAACRTLAVDTGESVLATLTPCPLCARTSKQ